MLPQGAATPAKNAAMLNVPPSSEAALPSLRSFPALGDSKIYYDSKIFFRTSVVIPIIVRKTNYRRCGGDHIYNRFSCAYLMTIQCQHEVWKIHHHTS